jgi:hypothetical protein
MGIMATATGGGDFKKLPPGAHFAICNMIVDCGLQPGYQGKAQHKIYVRWEVPDERVEWTTKTGEKREGAMTIGCFYTLSLSDRALLRRDLENWRGRAFTDDELQGFDVTSIAGKACQLQVTHAESGGRTYANVTGIMGLNKIQRDLPVKLENPLLVYSITDHEPDVFARLPEWLQKKISERLDRRETTVQHEQASDFDPDDDIPF